MISPSSFLPRAHLREPRLRPPAALECSTAEVEQHGWDAQQEEREPEVRPAEDTFLQLDLHVRPGIAFPLPLEADGVGAGRKSGDVDGASLAAFAPVLAVVVAFPILERQIEALDLAGFAVDDIAADVDPFIVYVGVADDFEIPAPAELEGLGVDHARRLFAGRIRWRRVHAPGGRRLRLVELVDLVGDDMSWTGQGEEDGHDDQAEQELRPD